MKINNTRILSCVLTLLFIHTNLGHLFSQNVQFESSNLPIIVIDTYNETIVDEPKITAHMGIIYNGAGKRNNLTDDYNNYDGLIGVELRGYSSQNWPKKPYAVETRNAAGENNNVSLLGLPAENDWVLHAPFVDKTLMRNALIYELAEKMGGYAPRTRYCELVLNNEYQGVYVLVEKIKKDKNRVDIDKPDVMDISGGYLLEMTMDDRVKDDETHFIAEGSKKPLIVKYPKPEKITNEQARWIEDYYNEFENVLSGPYFADSESGYEKYIDVPSFIDQMILAEGFHQLDAFSHSQYFYKKKNGKMFMGPSWDYNRTCCNAKYYNICSPEKWWLLDPRGGTRAAYANRLMEDPAFVNAYKNRWNELRQSFLSLDSIFSTIDDLAFLLDESKERNFERWPILGVSYSHEFVYDTYAEEVGHIKNWIQEKFFWMDEQFADSWLGSLQSNSTFQCTPFNTQSGNFTAEFDMKANANNMNGVTALSNTAANCDEYADLACIVRFGSSGFIDVRNNSAYSKDATVNYRNGEEFHVRMVVDINTGKYDVFITPKNGIEVKIADDYDFRSEQINVNTLNCFTIKAEVSTHNVTNFIINNNDNIVGITEDVNYGIELKNYPNPFSLATHISFVIPQKTSGSLVVYNLNGQIINILQSGSFNEGYHKAEWNGTDTNGASVSEGIYLLRLSTKGKVLTRKLVFTKH